MSAGRGRDKKNVKCTGALHYLRRKILRVQFAFRLMNQHQNLSEKGGYILKKITHMRTDANGYLPASPRPAVFPCCPLMQKKSNTTQEVSRQKGARQEF